MSEGRGERGLPKSVLVVPISIASFVWRCQLCPAESRQSWANEYDTAVDAGLHVRTYHAAESGSRGGSDG